MATGKNQYVYRLMKAQCSCSDTDFKQYLNLPQDHGVLFHDMESPLMNANDHVANENILTFGRCKSLGNPGGAVAKAIASVIIPFGGALLQKVAGCKCEPMTIVPWLLGDEDYYIDGAPALTLESELPCYYGGTIKIVLEPVSDDSGEDDSDDEEEQEEEKDVMAQLPSEVSEKINNFCDDEMSVQESAGEAALEAEAQAKEAELYERLNIPMLLTGDCGQGVQNAEAPLDIDISGVFLQDYLDTGNGQEQQAPAESFGIPEFPEINAEKQE